MNAPHCRHLIQRSAAAVPAATAGPTGMLGRPDIVATPCSPTPTLLPGTGRHVRQVAAVGAMSLGVFAQRGHEPLAQLSLPYRGLGVGHACEEPVLGVREES